MNRRLKIAEQYQPDRVRPATATALKYDPQEDRAPKVVATGRGKIAEQILDLARENGIPVCDDPVLAGVLSKVNLGDEIPPELYQVVAEVLAYIHKVIEEKR